MGTTSFEFMLICIWRKSMSAHSLAQRRSYFYIITLTVLRHLASDGDTNTHNYTVIRNNDYST